MRFREARRGPSAGRKGDVVAAAARAVAALDERDVEGLQVAFALELVAAGELPVVRRCWAVREVADRVAIRDARFAGRARGIDAAGRVADDIVGDDGIQAHPLRLGGFGPRGAAEEALLLTGHRLEHDGRFKRHFGQQARDFDQHGGAAPVVVRAGGEGGRVAGVSRPAVHVRQDDHVPLGCHRAGHRRYDVPVRALDSADGRPEVEVARRELTGRARTRAEGRETGVDPAARRPDAARRTGRRRIGVAGVEADEPFEASRNLVFRDGRDALDDERIGGERCGGVRRGSVQSGGVRSGGVRFRRARRHRGNRPACVSGNRSGSSPGGAQGQGGQQQPRQTTNARVRRALHGRSASRGPMITEVGAGGNQGEGGVSVVPGLDLRRPGGVGIA